MSFQDKKTVQIDEINENEMNENENEMKNELNAKQNELNEKQNEQNEMELNKNELNKNEMNFARVKHVLVSGQIANKSKYHTDSKNLKFLSFFN